ncbi:MAG: hypothetical protein ACRD0E_12785, partial [Acidimicrobiales bacterium]
SLITTQVDAAIPASSYTDSRFSPTLPYNSMSNPDYMKAPNLDAIYTDNCFALPRYAGYYNLQSSQPGGNASAATAASAAAPWLVRGAQHLFDRFQKIMSRAYSGRNYLNVANLSGWQWSDYYGDFATATNGLINTMNGGLMEGALGTSYGVSTWAGVRHAYNAVMDFCMSPKQVVLGCWVQGLASSLGTADYQQARYCISTTLMDDGYCCISTDGANSNGASYAVDDYVWWDEYGGNPNTNISKGWLGFPRGSRPSAAAVSGVWMRDFDNGVVLCNPKGNGARTITLAQINTHFGSSYVLKFFKGQQLPSVNSNSTMSSVTLQDSDGILLLKA